MLSLANNLQSLKQVGIHPKKIFLRNLNNLSSYVLLSFFFGMAVGSVEFILQ
jgi:hypothetical protein